MYHGTGFHARKTPGEAVPHRYACAQWARQAKLNHQRSASIKADSLKIGKVCVKVQSPDLDNMSLLGQYKKFLF